MSELGHNEGSDLRKTRTRPSLFAAGLIYLIAALGLFLNSFLAVGLNRGAGGSAQARDLLIALLYYLPFIALPLWLALRKPKDAWLCLRPDPLGPGRMLALCLTAGLCFLLANNLTILWAVPLQGLGFDLRSASLGAATTGQRILSILSMAVLPALCEEALFRGAIFSALESRGTKKAIWLSALLFALLHGSFLGLPAEILMGVVLAAVVLYCDSIYAGIVVHTVYNAIVVLVDSAQTTSAAAVAIDYFEAVGGLGGLIYIAIESLCLGLLLWGILKRYAMRAQLNGLRVEAPACVKLSGGVKAVWIAGLLAVGVLQALDIIVRLGGWPQ